MRFAVLSVALLTGCVGEGALDAVGEGVIPEAAGEAEGGDVEGPEDPAEGGGEPAPCALVEGDLPLALEGELLELGAGVSGARARCERALHAGAGAAGMTVVITLDGWAGDGLARLTAHDLLGGPLLGEVPLAPGESVELTLDQSGEFFITLAPEDEDAAGGDYGLSLSCAAGCDAGFTRYPIVLLHGMAGAESYLGVLDYWYDLDATMSGAGFAVVIDDVNAIDGVADRAAQWREVLDAAEAEGLGRRFNLIGHSQGGLDARYLAGALEGEGGRVASVITIGTPHRGSAAADIYAGLMDISWLDGLVIDAITGFLVDFIGLTGDDLTEQVMDLTTEAAAAFNEDVPDAPGVYYASWAGHTCGWLDWGCQADWGGEVVDPLFVLVYEYVSLVEGPNDGVVSVESARWGEFMGELPADHVDEVGQIADNGNQAFDHRSFFLGEAARLSAMGL